MNYKKEYLKKMGQVIGHALVVDFILSFGEWKTTAEPRFYPGSLDLLEDDERRTHFKDCWRFFQEVFQDDNHGMWKYLLRYADSKLLTVVVCDVFDNNPSQVLDFLQRRMKPKQVRKLIQENPHYRKIGIIDTGVGYILAPKR